MHRTLQSIILYTQSLWNG